MEFNDNLAEVNTFVISQIVNISILLLIKREIFLSQAEEINRFVFGYKQKNKYFLSRKKKKDKKKSWLRIIQRKNCVRMTLIIKIKYKSFN